MYRHLKRIADLVFALILLPFVFVVSLFVGIAIKLDDGGVIFYRDERIGRSGKIFRMLKFRSMKMNAPSIFLDDGNTYNSPDDDRVTRVGKFIRRTSIDELPQIVNIIRGEMSFIGPRPDYASWLPNYTDRDKIVLSVLPGITGYNQIVSRNVASAKEKLQNDIFYVENYSFMLDLRILFRTIKCVFLSENIYRS